MPVHPRACGEQFKGAAKGIVDAGSSPRLRGTVEDLPGGGGGGRFIPAPAGNSPPRGTPPDLKTVHPRACGEQENTNATEGDNIGSSPRLRGTDPCAVGVRRRGGFIPAPAGNSTFRLLGQTTKPVHPRACGEQEVAKVTVKWNGGSSPRLRGTANPNIVELLR